VIGPIAATDLRRHIETFEQTVATLWDRPLAAETRSALAAIRTSWSALADAAFGAIDRSRACPSCRRSNVQAGPRCMYCWHRLAASEVDAGV
jgi:hypothetical protein